MWPTSYVKKYIFYYRKDTHYSTKKRAKSAGRVPQSVRSEGLGRIWKCPDSTNKVSRIHENQIFSTMSKMLIFFPGFPECIKCLPSYVFLAHFFSRLRRYINSQLRLPFNHNFRIMSSQANTPNLRSILSYVAYSSTPPRYVIC